LLTKNWCDLFKTWNVNLGISLDGPESIHNSRRRTRRGEGTFQSVMTGLRNAQDVGFSRVTSSPPC
jgi:uncharacterized protein